MDELHQTAKAYYRNATREIKNMAEEFFWTLDQDNDEGVSLHEYIAYMTRQHHDHARMANPHFFRELNKKGTGKLDFMEVMTLFYILQSGRRYCDGCGEFMKSLFFACVTCFEQNGTPFGLCPTCFNNGNYTHDHRNFLDNYLLLERKRRETGKKASAAHRIRIEEISNYDLQQPTSAAIVPYCRQKTGVLASIGYFIAMGARAIVEGCGIM